MAPDQGPQDQYQPQYPPQGQYPPPSGAPQPPRRLKQIQPPPYSGLPFMMVSLPHFGHGGKLPMALLGSLGRLAALPSSSSPFSGAIPTMAMRL